MEPIFENVTVETEQMLKEFIQTVHRKRLLRNKIIMGFFAAAFLYLAVVRGSTLLYIVAAAYAGLAVWQFMVPGYHAKKSIQKKLAFYNQTNPPLTFRFFDDHFEVSDVDSWNSASYDKISAIDCMNHSILLRVENREAFSLNRSGFQKGTPEELVNFLGAKCPHTNPTNRNR